MAMKEMGVQGGQERVNGRSKSPEIAAEISIRLADLEKDSAAIAGIFGEQGDIEHLSGVAPAVTKRDIRKFRENIGEKMPDIKSKIPVLIAVKQEIEEYYRESSAELYVAEHEGKVVGTVTLEKGGMGIMWGQISRLAVSEKAKRQRVGTKLLEFVNHRMFVELGYRGASAGIIRGIDSDGVPLHMFERAGYAIGGTSKDICLGWSNAEEKFVYRNSVRVTHEAPRPAAVAS